MARALGWSAVAPFYIDLEKPVPPNGIPKPGPLQVHLKDDHLQYAITWFALAGAVVITFWFWSHERARKSECGERLCNARKALNGYECRLFSEPPAGAF